jgi:hypothetical protein
MVVLHNPLREAPAVSVTLYRLTEVLPPRPILEPGKYLIAHGTKPALLLQLYHPTDPSDLADMVRAMERSEAA